MRQYQNGPHESIRNDTDRKEDSDTDKDDFRGREHLSNAFNCTNVKDFWRGAYQANSFSEGIRKGAEDIDRRVEPFGQAVIGTLRAIELLDLLLKHCENATGSVASLELSSEWVPKEVLLCASLISFQGIIENSLKVGG